VAVELEGGADYDSMASIECEARCFRLQEGRIDQKVKQISLEGRIGDYVFSVI
jgi:hypothetical protein